MHEKTKLLFSKFQAWRARVSPKIHMAALKAKSYFFPQNESQSAQIQKQDAKSFHNKNFRMGAKDYFEDNFAQNEKTKVLQNQQISNSKNQIQNQETKSFQNERQNLTQKNFQLGNFLRRDFERERKLQTLPQKNKPTYKKKSQQTLLTNAAIFFDMTASLVFFAALFITMKPHLLSDIAASNFLDNTNFAQLLTKISLLDFTEIAQSDISRVRNFLVLIAMIIVVIFKLIAVALSRPPVKIVPILILMVFIIASIFVKKTFLFFLTLVLFLYFAFEFSCGFSWKTIFCKFFATLALVFFEYFALHFIFVNELIEIFF